MRKRFVKRRIINVMLLAILLVIAIGIYYNVFNSSAEKVIEFEATAIDTYGYLSDQKVELEAILKSNDSYEVQLPQSIDNKEVKSFLSTDDIEVENNTLNLTKEKIENEEINLNVEYDVAVLEQKEEGKYEKNILSEKTEEEIKQIQAIENPEVLCKKTLKYEGESGKSVELTGYLPEKAELKVKEVAADDIQSLLEGKTVKTAYDITIVIPEEKEDGTIEYKEFSPEEFNETCEVTIKDTNIEENAQVYHIKDDDTVEQIEVKENSDANIIFEASSFSVYAVTSAVFSDLVVSPSSAAVVYGQGSLKVQITGVPGITGDLYWGFYWYGLGPDDPENPESWER